MDFSDLDTLDGGKDKSQEDSYARIRKNAHVVNGGEETFSCKACGGSGRFRSYSGRVVGDCFKCKGKGRVTARQESAQKGVQTRKQNDAIFAESHKGERAYMQTAANGGFRLMARLLEKWNEHGRLNTDEIETVRKYMQQDADRQALRDLQRAEEKAQREASAPTVELSAIDKLFATAVDNQIKRPIFRADGLTLSRAPMNGRNAGALYVVGENDQYLGKLQNGKFHAMREAPADTIDKLMAIAADPLAESIKYARRTSRCGCCGHVLVDPVSILAGIGPICAEKWGLDYRRELARDEYAIMKAEEAGQKEMKI